MTEWQTKKVGELAETQLGKMLNKNKQTGKHSLPYLRSLNVQWGEIVLSDLNQMDIFPGEYGKFTLRPGDLLICEGGESGRAAIWNNDLQMGFQNALHRVRAGSEISNKYLVYYFEWLVKNQLIEHLFNGVTIKHFPQENLRSVEISYPTLSEQEKIVEILEDHLSRLDAALADVKQAKLKATQFRRSLLQAAFTGNLTGNRTGLKTEWQNKTLGELVSIKTGKIDANQAVENGKYPFFTCAREISRIDDAPYEGKVVLVAGNGDLNVKYYEGKFNAYQRTYFLTSLDESNALPKYIYFFMEHYLQILRTQSIGTTVKYIKMENLSDANIPFPTIVEQHKIVELLEDHLSRLDASVAIADAMEKQSASLRRSLLQAAFTGQLIKEVASV